MLISPLGTDDLRRGSGYVDKLIRGGRILWPYPLTKSGILAWWSADTDHFMTFNGNKVATWKDKLHGYTLAQATDARRPTYDAAGFGGNKAGVSFVAANQQYMTYEGSPFPVNNAECFMLLVVQQDALVADTTTHTMFAYGDNVSNQRKLQRRVIQGNNRAVMAYGNNFNTADGFLANTASTFDGKHVLLPFYSDVNSSLILDGVALGLCTYALRTAVGRTRVGASANDVADEFATCTIRDILIGDAASLTAEFLAGLQTWGANRIL